jgi:hypothetical protein
MKNLSRVCLIAAALAFPASAWAAVTTTAIAAGTSDWADLGIPSTGSIMVVQTTSSDIMLAIADVKPGVTPPVGFHLDPRSMMQVTLSTPAATHIWAIITSRGGVVSTGGYVIVTK